MKQFLLDTERQELLTLHRSEKNRRNADRIKAVLLADKGWGCKKISEVLLIDENTVKRHITEFKNDKKLKISSGGGTSKLNEDQTKELSSHLENNTYLKVIDICSYVKEKYGVTYTVAGIDSWLQKNGFSYKNPQPVPAKADPLQQKDFVEKYKTLKETTPNDEPIVFLDAVHPTMATKITHGWIKKGINKVIATTASRTRLNILGAINLKTMRIEVKSYKTIDSESMCDYLNFLKIAYPTAPKIHIILDQGPYNKSKVTAEAAKKLNIELHFLPTYSPNLNPIERLWKVMNEFTRNNVFFKSSGNFKEAIEVFFDKTWDSISMGMTSRINDNFQMFGNP